MDDAIPQGVKILTDVNIFAIGLTDDHPAYDDVRPWLTEALDRFSYVTDLDDRDWCN